MGFRLPQRTPTGDNDLTDQVAGSIFEVIKQAPIIGQFVGLFSGLFGKSAGLESRMLRVEAQLSQGATGYDDLNRADTATTLGRGPQMSADWVMGGDGQALRIRERAARLSGDTGVLEVALPAAGRRFARFPVPASLSKMTVTLVCDQSNNHANACTTVIWCANEAFTEFVYANIFGAGGVYMGRGTRAGNAWTFGTPWKQNPTARIGSTERAEGRSNGAGLYQLVIENTVIVSHQDTSGYPIDLAHRSAGFAVQCWTGFAQLPQYGWGVSAFAMRSEDDTFSAIGAVETVANNAVGTAMGAAVVATDAQVIAAAAQSTANAAQSAVEDALAGAQQTSYTWMPASAGVVLGRNEINIADAVIHPASRTYHCTSVAYGFEVNPGGVTVQLLKVSPARVATVVRTTTIAAGVVERLDDGFDVVIERGYRLACNVTDVTGVASVMLCTVSGALV